MKTSRAFFSATLLPLLAGVFWVAFCPAEGRERMEAQVDDKILTSTELGRLLRPIYRQYEESAGGVELIDLKKKARQATINGWVEKELILKEAKKLEKLVVDQAEIERRLKEAKDRFPSPEEFERALAREGMDEKKFRANLEDQYKVRLLTYQNVTSKIIVSPQEVMDYYRKHLDEFTTPEQVRVSYILIPVPENAAEQPAALAGAQSVLEKLKKGEDFAALARQYSKGPHADQGGDLGYYEKGQLRQALDAAAFSLPIGQHSEIIANDLGYHIVKVTGKKQAYRKPVEEIWENIDDKLFGEKFQNTFDAWIKRLKEKAYIIIED